MDLKNPPVYSIPIRGGLVGTLLLDADVVRLLLSEVCKLGAERRKVETSYLLIKFLGQQVYIILVLLRLLPVLEEVQLRKRLVRERAGHDEGWGACGAPKVQKPATRKDNDAMSVRELEAVDLGLDVLNFDALKSLKAGHVYLVVKVTDVAHDGVVLHLLHVIHCDDVKVASCGDENVHLAHDRLQRHHLEAFHAGLQRADRVDLADEHTRSSTTHGEGGALPDVSVAADQDPLSADHHISCTHDAVRQ